MCQTDFGEVVAVDSTNILFLGQVLTYQFKTHPNSNRRHVVVAWANYYILAAFVPSLEDESRQKSIGNVWDYKRVFGMTDYDNIIDYYSYYYPSWQPDTWTSVCVSVSKPETFIEVNINGENVATIFNYDGYFQDDDNNIILMNREDRQAPSHGAVSDVNVWRRLLSHQEIRDWQHCRKEPEGRVLTWEKAELDINGLNISDVNRSETCLKTTIGTNYIGYNLKKDFHGMEKFCENIGGKFAVSRDKQSFEEISRVLNKSLSRVSDVNCSLLLGGSYIYTGFKRNNKEWISVVTGQTMSWETWTDKFPKERPDFDCIIQDLSTGNIQDSECHYHVCPICEMTTERKNFILQGVCLESSVDSMFLMESPTEFLGYIQTTLRYSRDMSRWEIVNTTNTTEVLAFMRENDKASDFPIGVNSWYFIESNCTAPGEEFRYLNFHLDVKQPGHFCCDDGTCIDSQLVCNEFSDCDDGTDERNCTFLNVCNTLNNTETPPTKLNNGIIQPIVLNAAFDVFEIFEINEVEFSFDIHFILEIQWFNKYCSFEFLKINEYENYLFKTSREKIWIPNVEFSKIRKKIYGDSDNDNVIVSRNGKPRLDSNLDFIQANEVYVGEENPLKILMERRIQFSCSFDNVKNFPFGKQKCSVKFQLVGASNVLNTSVNVDKDVTVVGQYVIDTWIVSNELHYKTGRNMTRVTMVLRRKIWNIFMETYLPTILMNMINQFSNYITGDTKYDMIYTINVTCMMVLASIYLSVSASLPVTSDMKPIAVWLIFNLAYPFFIILVNVILQVREKISY